jgi:hypothetical protein
MPAALFGDEKKRKFLVLVKWKRSGPRIAACHMCAFVRFKETPSTAEPRYMSPQTCEKYMHRLGSF